MSSSAPQTGTIEQRVPPSLGTADAPTYPAKVSIRIVRAMLGMIEQPKNMSSGVTLEETMSSTMYPLSNHGPVPPERRI